MMFTIRQAKLPSPIWMQALSKCMAHLKNILQKQSQACDLGLLKTFLKAISSYLDQMSNLKMVQYNTFLFYITICNLHIVIIDYKGKAVL